MRCKIQKKAQYPNRRLAEKAMLRLHLDMGTKAFGSYKCPFCFLWHLTSQYDNRTKQSMHEFRQAVQKRDKVVSREEKDRKYREKLRQDTLPLSQQKEVMKLLNNQPYRPFWKLWINRFF